MGLTWRGSRGAARWQTHAALVLALAVVPACFADVTPAERNGSTYNSSTTASDDSRTQRTGVWAGWHAAWNATRPVAQNAFNGMGRLYSERLSPSACSAASRAKRAVSRAAARGAAAATHAAASAGSAGARAARERAASISSGAHRRAAERWRDFRRWMRRDPAVTRILKCSKEGQWCARHRCRTPPPRRSPRSSACVSGTS